MVGMYKVMGSPTGVGEKGLKKYVTPFSFNVVERVNIILRE